MEPGHQLMDLVVDLSDRGDRTATLYRALVSAIRAGRLRSGDRLPPTRALAQDLGVSRTTVATAYERLVAEGFAEGRVGAGTYVTDVATPRRSLRGGSALRPRSGWHWSAQPVSGTQPTPWVDLRVGVPDGALFPYATWRRLLSEQLRAGAETAGRLSRYDDPAGLRPLREAVVRHLGVARGVSAEVDQVVITNGTQQALDLVARVLLTPGDVVAVEEPGYPSARDLFASYGARVVGCPVDEQGLQVDRLPDHARLVFTTPSHQFPLGPPLSQLRRRALLAWADRTGAAVVEDDYDSEYRFVERPLAPLHAQDARGQVVYVGTFSKSLLPSLRTGYLIAPPSLVDALRAARQLADGYGPTAIQAALARFLDEGLLAGHVRRAGRAYAERRETLTEALISELGLAPVPSAAGLHLTAWRDGAGDLRERARAEGIVLDTVADYRLAPAAGLPDGLVLGYGALDPATLAPGLRRLGELA